MSQWPGRYDPTRGKQSRIRMLNKIISNHGGRIKYDALEKILRGRGYYHLTERLEIMGFFVDVDGCVRDIVVVD